MQDMQRAGLVPGNGALRPVGGGKKSRTARKAKRRSRIRGRTRDQRQAARTGSCKLLPQVQGGSGCPAVQVEGGERRQVAEVEASKGLGQPVQHKSTSVSDTASQKVPGAHAQEQVCAGQSDVPGPRRKGDQPVWKYKDALDQPDFYNYQREKLLARYFYGQSGVQELAQAVARQAPCLRNLDMKTAAWQSDENSATTRELNEAFYALEEATGLKHSQCVEIEEQFVARRVQHMKPAAARVECQLRKHEQELEKVQLDARKVSGLLQQSKTKLERLDKALQHTDLDRDRCRDKLAQERSESGKKGLREREQELNESIAHIRSERVALFRQMETLKRAERAGTERERYLLERKEKLTHQQRILEGLVRGFNTDEQAQQARLLENKLSLLVDLVQQLEVVEPALAASEDESRAGGRHHGENEARLLEQQALQQEIAQEEAAVRQLAGQLQVDLSALMVQSGRNGKIALSETAAALREYGFEQVTQICRSVDGVRVHLEFQARDETGALLEGEALLQQMRDREQKKLTEAGIDWKALNLLSLEHMRTLKKQVGWVADAYESRIAVDLNYLWEKEKPGVDVLSVALSRLLQFCADFKRMKQNGEPGAVQWARERAEPPVEEMCQIAAALGIERSFVDTVAERFEAVRMADGSLSRLRDSLLVLRDLIEDARTHSLKERLKSVTGQLQKIQARLEALPPGQSLFVRRLKENRDLLQDLTRGLRLVTSGFPDYVTYRWAYRLGECEKDLGYRLQLKQDVDQQLENCRNGFRQSLRSLRLWSAWHLYRAQTRLKKTQRLMQEEITDISARAREYARVLHIPERARMITRDADHQLVISDTASRLLSTGVTELTPVYGRYDDGSTRVTYMGKDENGEFLEGRDLIKRLAQRAQNTGEEAVREMRDWAERGVRARRRQNGTMAAAGTGGGRDGR